MEVRFEDHQKLARLEIEPTFTAGFEANIVKAFRNRMNFIRQAVDERAFYAMKSWHFEKLAGKRAGQHSIRLNDQFRLVLRLERAAIKTVVIVELVDYH
jgi:proteic killer suppression protein